MAMKKSFLILTLCAAALGFTSCGGDEPELIKLNTPELSEPVVGHNSASISWKAVDNADAYVYVLNDGAEVNTTETSVVLNDLTPATEYTFKVKACKDGSTIFTASEFATITFTTLDKPAEAKAYRVASFADMWDKWFYSYNEDGTPKRIYRTADNQPDGALDREWLFEYKGNTLNVTGKNTWVMAIDENKHVSKLIDGSNIYEYSYDADGYLTQVKKNAEVICEVVIENGNIAKWSKIKDGAQVWKLHTYTSALNVSGIHAITAEGIGASRWLVETGLFGKACRNLHATNGWDYSDKSSTFTFELDADGAVVKESKLYGEELEEFFYTYE